MAFWVSAGVRASELLGATQGDADPGQQLITVVRKGSRALQPVPASADAFVWLRLYQAQMAGLVPSGRDQPLWWTLRRPFRPLAYHAAHRMFTRASAALGANWSLHDLRHTAAYRMARDPQMPLTDVQWVLGHAHLSTTELYMSPLPEDVIAGVLAFHQRRAGQQATPSRPARRGLPGRVAERAVRAGPVVSAGPGTLTAAAPPRPGSGLPDGQADALRRRFPPRPDLDAWPRTRLARADLDALLAAAPFAVAGQAGEQNRRRGIGIVLDWLQAQPGATWQQRWQASGAGQDGRADWRAFPVRWRAAAMPPATAWDGRVVTAGLLSLICADVIRPDISWLLTTATPKRLAAEMARTRDPAGLTGLAARCDASPVGEATTRLAMHRVAVIMAAKGGMAAGITIGDCLELLDVGRRGLHDPALQEPVLLPAAACRGRLGQLRRADRARAGGGPPAQRRPADRPVRHRLPAGPRPAGGLPAGTPGQRGLRDAGAAGRHPRPPVLGRPGSPPSRDQLAAP